ncbi:hypothetical protein [Qaidamihabitans albus]|uniref:hypothetical protein n=1 Tax=Qaidamihabitans albus TaxID=2795733 RepID=UPI0018F23424|nr:hypothetical protein [Qaidamihabitans albus]
MPTSENSTERQQHERGRGWLLSLASILLWEAVLTLVVLVAAGPPDPDGLYYSYGPALVTVALFGTPLTYLVGWRRPRPFHQLALFALPVFLICLGLTQYA